MPQLLSLCSGVWGAVTEAHVPRPHAAKQDKPPQEVLALQVESSPCLCQLEKSLQSNKDQHSQ